MNMQLSDIAEIVELTPDYQNSDDCSWSWYENVAKARGIKRVDMLLWNDLVEGSELIAQFFLDNPSEAHKYNGEIREIVDSLFSHFVKNTREDIVHIMKRYVSASTIAKKLPAEFEDKSADDILSTEFYHGTGDKALYGLQKRKALLSEHDLAELGEPMMTGENELQRTSWKCPYVCFSAWPAHIERYAVSEGVRRLDDYPVIFGFPKANIDSLGLINEVYGLNYDQDGGEVSIKVPVPLSCATHVYAPLQKIDEINSWAKNNGIKNVLPIELFFRAIHHDDVRVGRYSFGKEGAIL
jgi:hypothetical protein